MIGGVGAGGERPPATRFGSADSNKMIIFLTPSFSVKNEDLTPLFYYWIRFVTEYGKNIIRLTLKPSF